MSLGGLISNFNSSLASIKNTCNCSSNYSYCNCSNIGNFMSNAMLWLPLIMSGASMISGFENRISAGIDAKRAASAAANGSSGSGSVDQTNSVFTYGNDYKTDYAANAVKSVEAELQKANADLTAKTSSLDSLDKNMPKINDAAEKAGTNLKSAKDGLKSAQDAYNNETDSSKKSALYTKVTEAEAKVKKAQEEYDAAEKAKTDAEKTKKELETAINTLNTETIPDLENKIKEYQEFDVANGSASDRVDTDTANANVENQTFEIQNARQLINEFAAARRAYETDPTADNKTRLQTAKDNFIKEYNEGDGNNNATLKSAYDLINKYEIKESDAAES